MQDYVLLPTPRDNAKYDYNSFQKLMSDTLTLREMQMAATSLGSAVQRLECKCEYAGFFYLQVGSFDISLERTWVVS